MTGTSIDVRMNVQHIPVEHCEPNPWNPNVMTDAEFDRLVDSLRTFGMIAPLLGVTLEGSGRQRILEGEHRWKAAQLLDMPTVPVNIIGTDATVSEARQRQITLFMNEVHGTHDPRKTAIVLEQILALDDAPLLPYADSEVNHLLNLYGELAIAPAAMIAGEPEAPYQKPAQEHRVNEQRQAWKTLQFVLPEAAALVVQQAIDACRDDGGGDDDWQCLTHLCADYLAGKG